MALHDKPVTGHDLDKFLRFMEYEVRPSKGSQVAVIGGTEIRIPMPNRKDIVERPTLQRLVRAFGFKKSRDLLDLMGRELAKAGKPSAALPAKPDANRDYPSKSETIRQVSDLGRHTARLEGWLRNGHHSPELYDRIVGATTRALRGLSDWPPPAEVAFQSPDDAGYKPTHHDSVLTGVGRATGVTARVVKRRRTVTAWEHNGGKDV